MTTDTKKEFRFLLPVTLEFRWDGETQGDAEQELVDFIKRYHSYSFDSLTREAWGVDFTSEDLRARPDDSHKRFVPRYTARVFIYPEFELKADYVSLRTRIAGSKDDAVLHVIAWNWRGTPIGQRTESWEIWRDGAVSETYESREDFYKRMNELEWEVEDVAS